jgi:hypothetical protein
VGSSDTRASARARAIALAKQGLWVFPVNSKSKKPVTERGQFSDARWSASDDVAVVARVFDKFPDARIGVATGESGLVVIDVDPRHGGGAWYDAQRAQGDALGSPYEIDTPSGGKHLYYRAPKADGKSRPIANSASMIAPGVDVRGEGGYVVFYGDTPALGPYGPVPRALRAASEKRRVRFDEAHPEEGERSDRLIRMGGAWVSQHWSWKKIEKKLRYEGDRCRPPFDEEELEKTVLKSVRKYYDEEHAPREQRARTKSIDGMLLPAELLFERQELPAQLVEGLLEQDTEASVIGPAGAAKSLLVLELGLSVSVGRRFFGHKTHAGPVLYLCGEGAGGIRRRFQALALARGIKTTGVPFAVLPQAFDMGGPEIGEALDEFEERYGGLPALIIVDTFSRYLGRDADENASGDLYAFFGALAEQCGGIARLVLHHTGHMDAKRGRGSSAWVQAVDTEFVLSVDVPEGAAPSMQTVRCLENTKQKDGELCAPKYFKLKRVATRTRREGKTVWSVVLDEVPKPADVARNDAAKSAPLGANEQKVYDVCLKLSGKSRSEIRDRCVKLKMLRQRVNQALVSLARKGRVSLTPEGKVIAKRVPPVRPSEARKSTVRRANAA